MIDKIDKALSAIPFDGYKSALGFGLQFIAPLIPGVGPVLKVAGDVLTILGLIHKGIKEQRVVEITLEDHSSERVQ